MASYININGNNIPIRASDPTNPILGEIWYNTTTNSLKGQAYQTAAWITGGTTNNTMSGGSASTAGTQTAFVMYLGAAPGVDANPGYTETYDGTSWTNQPTTPYPASGAIGFGTSTAAVGAGGQPGGGGVSTTIEWNGSAWGSGGSLPFATLYQYGGCGPGTDGITIGGWDQTAGPGGPKATTRVYDGSTWSTDPATCPFPAYTASHYGAGSSDVNYLGGFNPGAPADNMNNAHVNYNGTTYTSLTNYPLNIAGANATGTTSNGFVWNGNRPGTPGATDVGNAWDGSTWTTSTTSPQANKYSFHGGNTVGASIYAQGAEPYTPATFEYQAEGPVTKTISGS